MHISCHELQKDIWPHTNTVHIKKCSFMIEITIQCRSAEVQCLFHTAYTRFKKPPWLPSEILFPLTLVLKCLTIKSYLDVSDPGNEKFQRGWKVSPLKATTLELNMAATISSDPSSFRSANTGGDIMPFASSRYSSWT